MVSGDAWEAWLVVEHARSAGVWLKIAKKGSGEPGPTYSEALDAALCHGWIDGQKRPLDATFWLQRFTPRSPRSKWSAVNRARVDALVAAGRMRPAGLRAIESARADGRWEAAYPPQSAATVPEDLRLALDGNPTAAGSFSGLNAQNRYAILYRIGYAKRPETRARRIATFVAMLAEGRKLHP